MQARQRRRRRAGRLRVPVRDRPQRRCRQPAVPGPPPVSERAVRRRRGSDFDGDGLGAQQEYLLWRYAGPRTLPLSYSAGLKRTTGGVDDDLRDADADGIGNWDEFNGRMTLDWWGAIYKGEKPYTEHYAGTSAVDSDSDGDGVLDGADDTDHDGWTNVAELSRARYRVQPFNPCLPDYLSPTCTNHPPVDGPYPPFDAPLPPSPIQTVA